jgi:hypothetical protein
MYKNLKSTNNKNIFIIAPAIILLLGIFGVFSHRFDLIDRSNYRLSECP